jgi:oligosaccharide repeat unit polymerase
MYVFFLLRSQGIGLAQITSVQGLGQTAVKMSLERYSNTTQDTGVAVQLLLSVMYLAPLFGGTLFVRRRRRSDIAIAALTMVPCLVSFAAQSTRSAVLYGATMWVAGYLTARIYSGLPLQRIHLSGAMRRLGPAIIGLIAFIIALVATGDALRGGFAPVRGTIGDRLLSNRIKDPLSGHLGALSMWIDNTDLGEIDPSFGRYTIAGVYNLLQPGSRTSGVFSENVQLPTGETNIYTYFRALIEDASLPGSIFVMWSVGFLGGFFYRKVKEGRQSWNGLLATSYAWSMFGITSLFNYNSMLAAFALYCFWWAAPWRRRVHAWGQ